MLEGGAARCPEVAAEAGALLPERHLVSPICCCDGRLHAARAAADNEDRALLARRCRQPVVALGIALGIHGAVVVLAGEAGEQALVAADAGTDIVEMPCLDLLRPERIGQHLVRQDDLVERAVLERLFCLCRVEELALPQHRNGRDLLDSGDDRKLVAFRRIDRGDGFVPCLVAAHIHMEGIGACAFEDLCHLDTLVERASALDAVVGRELHEHREALWHIGLDGSDAFAGEAHVVLERSAILIGAVVPHRGLELVEQVSAVGMELDGIGTGCHSKGCRIADTLDEIGDVFLREGLADELREPERGACTR